MRLKRPRNVSRYPWRREFVKGMHDVDLCVFGKKAATAPAETSVWPVR